MKHRTLILACCLFLLFSFLLSSCGTEDPADVTERFFGTKQKETQTEKAREKIIGEATLRILSIQNDWFFGVDYNTPGVYWNCRYHIGSSFAEGDVVSITYTTEEPGTLPEDNPYYEKCTRYTIVTAETVAQALIVPDVTMEMDIPS